MRKLLKENYHWVIAAVALLQMLIYGGAVNNFSGYHMIPVTEALGISRTAFSLAESARSVAGVIATLFSGLIIQRFGFRKSISAALGVACVAYLIFANLQTYWMLIAGCVLMGIAHGFCFTAGVTRLINGWFHKYRGTVIGLVTAATGVGSTLLGFVQAPAVERVSWRLSFWIVAGLQFFLALLVFLLVRNEPRDVGLRPYGEGQTSGEKKKVALWDGFPMDFLKKRPSYYLLCVCTLLSCMCVLMTQYNLVPYFQDCGMSVTRTSKLYGIMMLALGIFKLLMGVLCDAIGSKRVLVLCHVACAVGLSMVLVLPQTDMAMILALIVFDLAIPLTTMMFPLVSLDLFGIRSQHQYVGTVVAMATAGNIFSGMLANAVYDHLGSYRPVFWASVILSLAMIPIYGIVFAAAKRDKKAYDSQLEVK